MISRDPDQIPSFPPELLDKARKVGKHPVSVICDEPGAKPGDLEGVQFFAIASFIPRVGEKIKLENGRVCIVQSITYVTVTVHNQLGVADEILLQPNIYAVAVDKQG